MRAIFAIALLSDCGDCPVDALCVDSKTDAEVTKCTSDAINTAAGYTVVTVDGLTVTAGADKRTARVVYVDAVIVDGKNVSSKYDGMTSAVDGILTIQVTKDKYGDRWTDAATLAHEIGHVLGLRFDNPSDPIHSADESDLMFYRVAPFVSSDNLRAFVKQIKEQGL